MNLSTVTAIASPKIAAGRRRSGPSNSNSPITIHRSVSSVASDSVSASRLDSGAGSRLPGTSGTRHVSFNSQLHDVTRSSSPVQLHTVSANSAVPSGSLAHPIPVGSRLPPAQAKVPEYSAEQRIDDSGSDVKHNQNADMVSTPGLPSETPASLPAASLRRRHVSLPALANMDSASTSAKEHPNTGLSEPKVSSIGSTDLKRRAHTSAHRSSASVAATGKRVLVVEDSQPTRRLLCMLLQNMGYTTTQAEHGAIAVQMFEDFHRSNQVSAAAAHAPLTNQPLADVKEESASAAGSPCSTAFEAQLMPNSSQTDASDAPSSVAVSWSSYPFDVVLMDGEYSSSFALHALYLLHCTDLWLLCLRVVQA